MRGKFKLLDVLLAIIFFAAQGHVAAAPNWNTNTIQVTGEGMGDPAKAISSEHLMAMAKRAAIADAHRKLAEAINGVQVDAETTVEQMVLTSDIVRTKVHALVRNARIVDESALAGGAYSVTMEIPLFGGSGSLSESVITRPTKIEPFRVPAPDYRPPVDYTPPAIDDYQPTYRRDGNYTGLIVDCRGLGRINPVMSPVIKDEHGEKIYGHKNLDYDRIIREGMASYARSMSEASRAGKNPLVVRAIALDDLNATPVLTDEDADMVLYENKSSHFLDDIAVVFLY